MKSLFKSKPRTPTDIVRHTRDLLRLLQQNVPNTSKRDDNKLQMPELYKNIRELKSILYGDSESEPVPEACAQLTQEFFKDNTLQLLIQCLPKLNFEEFSPNDWYIVSTDRGFKIRVQLWDISSRALLDTCKVATKFARNSIVKMESFHTNTFNCQEMAPKVHASKEIAINENESENHSIIGSWELEETWLSILVRG